jgi:hypothetical protein
MSGYTLPNGLRINYRVGHLDKMPRCKVCGKVVCSHSDLEFSGVTPPARDR